MDGPLPLSALLSQVLVAFIIEFDNEAEHRLPHRTTDYGSTSGLHAPWLASMAMWQNCMKHLPATGLSLRELERRARTPTNLDGMRRWGYIWFVPNPADHRSKPPRSAWLMIPTPAGHAAQEIWRPLPVVIEKRWQQRFGGEAIDRLREPLLEMARRLDPGLPDCLPILGYGLFSAPPNPRLPPPDETEPADLPLPALLSKVLLVFAIEFEQESKLSLAICANVLRVLDENGIRLRDIPSLSGVSKEAISMAMGILRKFGLAVVEKDTKGGTWKVVRLTPKGSKIRSAYPKLLGDLEKRWQARFDKETLRKLRESLEELVGDGTPERSPLFAGLEPYPGGWRSFVRRPATLPHYPMVLHRGGWPDGS